MEKGNFKWAASILQPLAVPLIKSPHLTITQYVVVRRGFGSFLLFCSHQSFWQRFFVGKEKRIFACGLVLGLQLLQPQTTAAGKVILENRGTLIEVTSKLGRGWGGMGGREAAQFFGIVSLLCSYAWRVNRINLYWAPGLSSHLLSCYYCSHFRDEKHVTLGSKITALGQ